MPSRKRRYNRTSPTFGPKKFGAAVRRYLKERELLSKAEDHQTFPWLVTMVKIWVEGQTSQANFDGVSVRTQNKLRKMSLETLQTLYSLGQRNGLIIRPEALGPCIDELVPDIPTRSLFKLALRKQCAVYLEQTLWSEPGRIPPVVKPREKPIPNRKRDELPDPEQPAWASINRREPKKLQIACRVEPQVKKRIKLAAEERGLSQAAWLDWTITSALVDQGFEVHRVRPYKPKFSSPVVQYRTPRKVLPAPEQSRNASVNRADRSTSLRMCGKLAEYIDEARRPNLDRSEWLNASIRSFLDSGEELPDFLASGPLTEVCALRFERDFFDVIEAATAEYGLTKSAWFRRVAYWKLKKLHKS